MTDILDKNNTIKTEKHREMWTIFYTEKWCLERVFSNIREDILQEIVIRCNGNPLFCLILFVNLL
jgi:hypothetical protein